LSSPRATLLLYFHGRTWSPEGMVGVLLPVQAGRPQLLAV